VKYPIWSVKYYHLLYSLYLTEVEQQKIIILIIILLLFCFLFLLFLISVVESYDQNFLYTQAAMAIW